MASLGLGYLVESDSDSPDLTLESQPTSSAQSSIHNVNAAGAVADAEGPTGGLQSWQSSFESSRQVHQDSQQIPECFLPADTPVTSSQSPTNDVDITFPLPCLDTLYPTPEDALNAVNAFAKPHGYGVSTLRSKVSKKGIKKTVHLCCDRGRDYRTRKGPANPRKRQTSTRAIGCPFRLVLRLELTTGLWRITLTHSSHNHEPSPASTHPVHRTQERVTKKDTIETALKQGQTASQILQALRDEDSESCLVAQDIYNMRKRLYMDMEMEAAASQILQALRDEDAESCLVAHDIHNMRKRLHMDMEMEAAARSFEG